MEKIVIKVWLLALRMTRWLHIRRGTYHLSTIFLTLWNVIFGETLLLLRPPYVTAHQTTPFRLWAMSFGSINPFFMLRTITNGVIGFMKMYLTFHKFKYFQTLKGITNAFEASSWPESGHNFCQVRTVTRKYFHIMCQKYFHLCDIATCLGTCGLWSFVPCHDRLP